MLRLSGILKNYQNENRNQHGKINKKGIKINNDINILRRQSEKSHKEREKKTSTSFNSDL